MRVHVCLARREGYLRDRKKKTKIRTIFLACIFHLFSFFRFRTVARTASIRGVLSEARNVACRARPRPDSGVVLRESARV